MSEHELSPIRRKPFHSSLLFATPLSRSCRRAGFLHRDWKDAGSCRVTLGQREAGLKLASIRKKVWQQVGMRPFMTGTKDRPGNLDPPDRRDQNPVRRTRQQCGDEADREIERVEAIGPPQGGDQRRLAGSHAEADDGTANAEIEQSLVLAGRLDRVLIGAQLGDADRRYAPQPRTVER